MLSCIDLALITELSVVTIFQSNEFLVVDRYISQYLAIFNDRITQ